ncbi:hypothetical protein PybrP1_000256 [[Pythium] brassicae (nom. inval.)]|nr:hypothetical protein PybrP1_000256 [[Pythium] brassicae (nom. inval.)]
MVAKMLLQTWTLLLLLPAAYAVFVEFRRDLARSYASSGLFPTDATDVASDAAWLQSYRRSNAGATNGGYAPVACAEVTDESCGSNAVPVVVGISSCLTDATIAKIKDWIAGIAATKPTCWKNDASAALKFKFVLHASTCAPPSQSLLTRNKLSRLDGFKAYGAVVSALPPPSDDVTAAVMFFQDDGSALLEGLSAYKTLTDYEEKAKVPLAYNFQVNELANGAAPTTLYSNAKYLASISELRKVSLFTAVTRYACAAKLPNSKPFPFLDASGTKRCLCTCPAGYELTETSSNKLSCQKLSDAPCGTCVWDAFGPLKFEVTDALKTCDLSGRMAASGMPVPYLMTPSVDEGKSSDPSRQLTFSATQQVAPVYSGDAVASFLYAQQKLNGKIDREALLLRRPLQLPRSYSGLPKYTPTGGSSATKTSTCAWTKYQETPSTNFAKLPITGYGKYKLVATAAGGGRTDSCAGCLAVVDQSRPRATTQCPAPFFDSGAFGRITVGGSSELLNAELTAGNLDKADAAVQQVFVFQSNATNDACSADNRCDSELFELRNFFDNKFAAGSTKFSDGRECFAPKRVWSDFLGSSAAQQSPFSDDSLLQADVPVSSSGGGGGAQCTRCCRLNVALKERWVDYLCDATYDTERCDGSDSEACAYTQCLTLTGSSTLAADAQVRPSIKTESDSVLKELAGAASTAYAAVPPTEIHRALACTKFGETRDDSCTFRSTVSALVSTTAAFKATLNSVASGKDASAFVFWRYRVAGDATWRLLAGASAAEHVFAQSETQIALEAWSRCGLVRTFSFRVVLHVHSSLRVCESFDMMWYQASVARLKLPGAPLCNVPKSDFVELTFDYRPSFGLEMTTAAAASEMRSSLAGVVCSASLNARPSAEIVRVENAKSFEIVRRFAVQLQTLSRTAALTTLNMTCAFTFTRFDKSTTALTCSKSFWLKDCDAPCANTTALNAACSSVSALATCASTQQPGPFDACGGTSVLSATDAKTQLTVASKTCCQSCSGGVATSCVALVEVPNEASGGSASVRRCEPQVSASIYAREAFASASSVRAAAPTTLAFGALFAVGVVTRRRRRAQLAKHAEAAETAELYALLASAESASAKEIKDAYFRLAKTLHPDVTGNDKSKAELFKSVSEAHAVLSDANRRRQYDAARPERSFGPQSTGGGRMHPYAARAAAEAAARGYDAPPDYTARPMYGIDEEVWIAHHYGVQARRSGMPGRFYGMHIVEERMEEEEERIRRRKQHYKMHRDAGYFMRRDARLRKRAAEETAKARDEEQQQSQQHKANADSEDANCVIS